MGQAPWPDCEWPTSGLVLEKLAASPTTHMDFQWSLALETGTSQVIGYPKRVMGCFTVQNDKFISEMLNHFNTFHTICLWCTISDSWYPFWIPIAPIPVSIYPIFCGLHVDKFVGQVSMICSLKPSFILLETPVKISVFIGLACHCATGEARPHLWLAVLSNAPSSWGRRDPHGKPLVASKRVTWDPVESSEEIWKQMETDGNSMWRYVRICEDMWRYVKCIWSFWEERSHHWSLKNAIGWRQVEQVMES